MDVPSARRPTVDGVGPPSIKMWLPERVTCRDLRMSIPSTLAYGVVLTAGSLLRWDWRATPIFSPVAWIFMAFTTGQYLCGDGKRAPRVLRITGKLSSWHLIRLPSRQSDSGSRQCY